MTDDVCMSADGDDGDDPEQAATTTPTETDAAMTMAAIIRDMENLQSQTIEIDPPQVVGNLWARDGVFVD
jgi:hypothetical protein